MWNKLMEMTDCVSSEANNLTYLERIRYYPRQLMTADDMHQEQAYFMEKLRRHNRFIHGWGIVCGLTVKADTRDKKKPWSIIICPGYALDAYGNEIYVGKNEPLDLETCLSENDECRPCDQSLSARADVAAKELYVVIKYAEFKTRPQRTFPAGCGCDETVCEYSRVKDSYKITCLPSLPQSHLQTVLDKEKSDRDSHTWPSTPQDSWIVLAKIDMSGTEIVDSNIRNDNEICKYL
jgi:hypothetical protein